MSWEPEDRAKAVAYFLEKNERCSMCGTASWEWAENRFAYEAVEEECSGCMRKQALTETIGNKPGVSAVLVPTRTIEHIRRQMLVARRHREQQAEKRALRRRG